MRFSQLVATSMRVYGCGPIPLLSLEGPDGSLSVRHARAFVVYELINSDPYKGWGERLSQRDVAAMLGTYVGKVADYEAFERCVRERFPWPSELFDDLQEQRIGLLSPNPPISEDEIPAVCDHDGKDT